MSAVLSWHRLRNLIEGDVIARYRSLAMVGVTLASLMLVGDWLTARSSDPAHLYRVWFVLILTTWGPIAASASFRELHDKTRNAAYLLLPASALEKTLARLLLLLIGLTAYVLAIVTIASLIGEVVGSAVGGGSRSMLNPLDRTVWAVIPHCLVIESLYFAGAAWFRRTHFMKTTFAITLLSVGLLAAGILVLRFMLGADLLSFGDIGDRAEQLYRSYPRVIDASAFAFLALYFVALPVVCWVIAWLRVGETQVSDGV
jgi:hypothetical protein